MLKGAKIVCVGFPKWEGEYMKSTVQLMTELALHNDVLYIDYPYTWKDLYRAYKSKDNQLVKRLMSRQVHHKLENKIMDNGAQLKVLTLKPFIPANWLKSANAYQLLSKWNANRNLQLVRKVLSQIQFDSPIIINAFNPALGRQWARKFNEKILVYYCYDEISAAPWIKAHGSREEKAFMQVADMIITSSTQLQKTKSAFNSHCYTVKNGVNYELFGRKNAHPAFVHPDAHPIVGYLGSVDDRLDYQLLQTLIKDNQDKHFLFVGRTNSKEGEYTLSQFDNVTLAGPQPIHQLPNWVASFDVGTIPFEKNKLTASIYPLKINEYLAQGKPVVTTSFSDLTDFESNIIIADEPADFKAAINHAMLQNQAQCIEKRRAVAQENSWPKRAEQFGMLIQNYLMAKS